MKCVLDKDSGKVLRVSDKTALHLTEEAPRRWEYAPKHLWKAQKEKKQ
jgi:hypothetical protein